jgi:hypothetical protein
VSLFVHAVQGRDPIVRKIGSVSRSEEPLRAFEQTLVVVEPTQRAVASERVRHLIHVKEKGAKCVHAASAEERTRVIGECYRCLGADATRVSCRVTADELAGSLTVQQFSSQAWIAPEHVRELVSTKWAFVCKGPVQAKFVTEPYAETGCSTGHIADDRAHAPAYAHGRIRAGE